MKVCGPNTNVPNCREIRLFSESKPEFSFPQEESDALKEAYSSARVILEYGSGGSTVLAAEMSGKLVFSVESDRMWALGLQKQMATGDYASPATVYYVDIGRTGRWGRPIDESGWVRYIDYPNAIWDEAFFRHPDVILIDGRFRVACLLNALVRITRPVTVLFDDYVDRRPYHIIDEFLEPREIAGRMAIFDAKPGEFAAHNIGMVAAALAQVTVDGQDPLYDLEAAEAIKRRREDQQ